MRLPRSVVALTIGLGLLPPLPRPAAGATEVDIALNAGFHGYSMSQVNDAIAETNEDLAGTGFTIEEIGGGGGFGAGLRVWPEPQWCVLLDFTRLIAKSSREGQIEGVPVNFSLEVPASAFTATVGYFRPYRAIRYGIGAGGGYYSCEGSISSNVGGARQLFDLHGWGIGYHLLGMADLTLSSSLHLEAAIGYRSAKTSSLESNGTVFTLDDGSTFEADWTGLSTRFGITLSFDPGTYPD